MIVAILSYLIQWESTSKYLNITNAADTSQRELHSSRTISLYNMSGGGPKKKPTKGHGWEEAGAEFYQESYPTDAELDVLQRDPKHLATLLPSKQTRATTIRLRNTDTRTFRRQTSSRSRRESTVHRRTSTAVDVQVSMMPDLSQDISTEQTTWEEIMQIKAMPVPMSQKKEMKAKILNEPNLRLQGFEQFKWQRRKVWAEMKARLKETCRKVELWKGDLKKIEGNFGTGVVAYFLFLKWLLFVNVFIFAFIFIFIVLPSILFASEFTSECTDVAEDECCSLIYHNQSTQDSLLILDLVQGSGRIERTRLFYGFYVNQTFTYQIDGLNLYYNFPLAYISVTVLYFIVSLVAIVKSAAKGFKERLVEGEGQFYQYCNLVFGGWDFCIHNEKSAAIKHKGIYNEIKGLLESERLEEERQNRTRQEKIQLLLIRILINLIVVAVLCSCGVGIYFAFDFSTTKLRELENVNDTSYISVADFNNIQQLVLEFLPSIAIVGLNIIVPFIFKYLVTFERYSPLFVIRLTLVRTIFLRLSSLMVLYASLYSKVSCKPADTDVCMSSECGTPICWETYVGQQFYKLVLTDFATNILITFFINFPRALIAEHINSKFAKLIGEQTFDLPKHVLDVVYLQTLCWIGSFFTPLLPFICIILSIVVFYIKKFACLVNSKPSSTIYRASRSNSMFMIVLLVSYAVCGLLPIAYVFAELAPSRACGPFRGLESIWSTVVEAFVLTPAWLQSFVFFLSTAGFAIPVLIILLLLLYYYSAVNSANRHMVNVLKNQLVLEGHDKQFLLDRLSMFIKQQQENQKRLRHAEMLREAERNASSN